MKLLYVYSLCYANQAQIQIILKFLTHKGHVDQFLPKQTALTGKEANDCYHPIFKDIINVPARHAETKNTLATGIEVVLQRSVPQHVTSQSLICRFA